MKKLSLIVIVFLSVMMSSSCKKEAADNNSAREQQTQFGVTNEVEAAAVSWVTVLPTTSFSSYSTYWNNLYPWGSDHNGSARMRSQNIATSGGVLTMTAYPGTVSDKASIHYFSGTCYAKQQVNVSASWPKWRVSGEFQCP